MITSVSDKSTIKTTPKLNTYKLASQHLGLIVIPDKTSTDSKLRGGTTIPSKLFSSSSSMNPIALNLLKETAMEAVTQMTTRRAKSTLTATLALNMNARCLRFSSTLTCT